MPKEREPAGISPEEVFLYAFEYFQTEVLDRESLIRIALTAGSPSRQIAIEILDKMSKKGLLTKVTEENVVKYKRNTQRKARLQ